MLAVICERPGKLSLTYRPNPEPGPGEVAVDVKAVGVCGTDFHIFEGTHPFLEYPRVMGHELSGVVADGSGSARLPAGTPVIINPYLSCAACKACRDGKPNCCMNIRVLGVHIDGGMCSRIVVPETNLYPAAGLSNRDAAMVEFLAIGAHAVRRADLKPTHRALVVGAGPIGTGAALFARAAGADVTLMDLSERRLAYLQSRLGFAKSVLAGDAAASEIVRITAGENFDVVFDATGNARAMEKSFGYVAHGGSLVFVGVIKADIGFADAEFHKREMSVLASRNATRADFETVVGAVANGAIDLDALNTHRAALADLPQAMPDWIASGELPLKAVLTVG